VCLTADALNRVADALFQQAKALKTTAKAAERSVAVSEALLEMQAANLAVTRKLEERWAANPPMAVEMLAQMEAALETAQTELAVADIALMEATARQQVAQEAASRLQSAVAALGGKAPAEPAVPTIPEATALSANQVLENAHGDIHELTPEEFDAERKRKQRVRDKERRQEEMANNPLAHVKCSGCGRQGTMQDTVMQAPSGATVRMMVCYKCNNQVMS